MTNLDSILKAETLLCQQRSSSQGYGFSSSHVWMWELDCEESWVPKSWCFWTAVLEKTLESPLDCKEIQPVHSEEDRPWDFFGRNDAKAETPVLCYFSSIHTLYTMCAFFLYLLEAVLFSIIPLPMNNLHSNDSRLLIFLNRMSCYTFYMLSSFTFLVWLTNFQLYNNVKAICIQ